MTSFLGVGMAAMLLAGVAPFAAIATAETPLNAWGGAATEWFVGVNSSEVQLRTALARGHIESSDCDATIGQIRAGSAGLRALMLATMASDSLLLGPLISQPPPQRPQGQWGDRFIRTTSIVGVSVGLTNMAAGWRGASIESRRTMGTISSVAGGAGALFSLVRPRPKPIPTVDPVEKLRAVIREILLRDTFTETDRQLRELIQELESIHSDSADTYSDKVLLVRRYAGAIERASALLDIQVPHASTVARTSSGYPHFSDAGRARLSLLADHLDLIGAQWRTWRWLAGRSQRDALGFLAMVEAVGARAGGGGSTQSASSRP